MGERTRLLRAPFPLAVSGIGLAPRLELAGLRIRPEEVSRGLPGMTAAATTGTGSELCSIALARLLPLTRGCLPELLEVDEDADVWCRPFDDDVPAAVAPGVGIGAAAAAAAWPLLARSTVAGGVLYRLLPPFDAAVLPF